MGNCTQVFHAVAFFLQRIIRCGSALYADLGCLDLKWLFCLWGCHQSSLYDDGCTYVQFGDLCKILHSIMINNLKGLKKSTIMKHNKSKCLGITYTSDPATYSNLFIQILLSVFINFFYCC